MDVSTSTRQEPRDAGAAARGWHTVLLTPTDATSCSALGTTPQTKVPTQCVLYGFFSLSCKNSEILVLNLVGLNADTMVLENVGRDLSN